MNLKDAIAEIKQCRLVDAARAAVLEAKMLGRTVPRPDRTDDLAKAGDRALFRLP
jgi:hypothetical protein